MENSPVQQIKDRLGIKEVVGSYIKLQKTGINFRAVCPFHSEKKPSFFVSPARQSFKCFGCNSGGDIFEFVQKIEGVEFGDALRILARKAGVELKAVSPQIRTERQRLYEICELACCFFQKQLKSSVGKAVGQYLLQRGLTAESIDKWRLGYSPDTWQALSDFLVGRGYNRQEIVKAGLAVESEKGKTPYDRFRGRIIFPVFDFNSQVIGFGGRITEGQEKQGAVAKYLNTPNTLLYDKSRVLYGLNFARVAIRKENNCILTEGYTDVILSHQAGFENTVASSGTALTPWQLKILKRYSNNLLTAFDMDVAGDSATKKGIDLAQQEDFNVKVISMPPEQDPADVVAQNPEHWQKMIDKAQDIMDFYFDSAFVKFDKESPQGKKEISETLLPKLKTIPNKILQAHWVQKLANAIKVGEEVVVEELKKIKGKESRAEAPAPVTAAVQPTIKTRNQLLEEKIISLLIASPQDLDMVEDQDLALFSPQCKLIVSSFKKAKVDEKSKLEKTLIKLGEKEQTLKEMLDTASMRAEVEETTEPAEEIQLCLSQLREIHCRAELAGISQEIKAAEQEGDQKKLKTLIERFNQSVKHLTTY